MYFFCWEAGIWMDFSKGNLEEKRRAGGSLTCPAGADGKEKISRIGEGSPY